MGGTRAKLAGGLVAAVIVAAGLAGIWAFVLDDDDIPDPTPTAQEYLAAWEDADDEAMAALVADPPEGFADDHKAARDALRVSEASYELGEITTDGDRARADFDANLMLDGLGEWSYAGRLRLEFNGENDAWEVVWTPAAMHPALRDDLRLGRTRERAERAPLTDAAGEPLVSAQPALAIGVEPQRIEDLEEVKDTFAEHLDVDPETVDSRLDAPGVEPHHFVEIVTVSRDRYEAVREAVFPVPGILFLETTLRQGPSQGFAQHVLGRTGEITAELLDELGPTYQVGDIVGMTGLERRFEEQLAGTPSGEIQLRDSDDDVVEVIDVIEGTDPALVATTLDADIQSAVEAALADIDSEAAAVVVDADGNVRAVASRPLDDGFNRALAGRYPPGSTFKVITADALLNGDMTPTTSIDCPPTVVAGGREFSNFESTSLGTVPFATAFAESCNTAFINGVTDVPEADLIAAAERFGFNAEYSVGLTTEGGSFPEPTDATEKAAAAIGQARILASPLHMATVAAAVNDGTWEPPTLLQADGSASSRDLDPGVRDTLAELMRLVVTEGSGTAAAVAGADIAGKTGTAEFDVGDPPPTHAWFIGFRGDHAVAIVLEGGGIGGRNAAPIARDIFAALPD